MTLNFITKKFFIGLAAGGYAGAIIALLFINKSRKKLRGNLEQKSQEYFDETNKYFTGTKNKTGDLINEKEKKILNDNDVMKSKPKTKLQEDNRVFNEAKSTDVFNSGNETSGTETERIRRNLLRNSSQK